MHKLDFSIIDSGIPGKTFVFTGGIHGDELGGPAILKSLKNYFEKNKLLKGKLVLIPELNPLALSKNTRRYPETGEDLNRCFVDVPETEGEKICKNIFEQIILFKPDQVIDIHNDWKSSIPYTILDSKNSVEAEIFNKNMCTAEKINFPIVVEEEFLGMSLSGFFCKKGISALALEIGGDKKIYKKFVRIGRNNLLDLLHKEEMASFSFWGWLRKFRSPKKVSGKLLNYFEVNTNKQKEEIEKINYLAKPKQLVKEGDVLCEILLKSGKTEKITSTISGIILSHNEKTPVYPESALYAIGKIPE